MLSGIPVPAATSRRATVPTLPHPLVSKRLCLFQRPLANRKKSRRVFPIILQTNRNSTVRGVLRDGTLDPIHVTTLKTEGVTSLVNDKVMVFGMGSLATRSSDGETGMTVPTLIDDQQAQRATRIKFCVAHGRESTVTGTGSATFEMGSGESRSALLTV